MGMMAPAEALIAATQVMASRGISKFLKKQADFGYFSDDFPRNPPDCQGKYQKTKKKTMILDINIQNHTFMKRLLDILTLSVAIAG